MEHIEAITQILTIVATIFLGGKWILGRIEDGQKNIMEQQEKMLKRIRHKVSRSECEEFRKSCPCFLALKNPKG